VQAWCGCSVFFAARFLIMVFCCLIILFGCKCRFLCRFGSAFWALFSTLKTEHRVLFVCNKKLFAYFYLLPERCCFWFHLVVRRERESIIHTFACACFCFSGFSFHRDPAASWGVPKGWVLFSVLLLPCSIFGPRPLSSPVCHDAHRSVNISFCRFGGD